MLRLRVVQAIMMIGWHRDARTQQYAKKYVHAKYANLKYGIEILYARYALPSLLMTLPVGFKMPYKGKVWP